MALKRPGWARTVANSIVDVAPSETSDESETEREAIKNLGRPASLCALLGACRGIAFKSARSCRPSSVTAGKFKCALYLRWRHSRSI